MSGRLDIDFDLIEAHNATDEEKRHFERIMRRGNNVLKQYLERIKVKSGKAQYSCQKFRKELALAVKENPNSIFVPVTKTVTVPRMEDGKEVISGDGQPLMVSAVQKITDENGKVIGIPVSQSDYALIAQVKEIEDLVLRSFAKMIFKFANLWQRKDHGTTMTFADFYSEAIAAVVTAIYQYRKEENEFSTYVHWAIHRRLQHATNENKPFSPWSNENRKLFGRYTEAKHACGFGVSFDQVVSTMMLDSEEANDLQKMLRMLNKQTDLGEDRGEKAWKRNNAEGINAAPARPMPVRIDVDQMEAVRKTPMTDWEKEVFKAFLTGRRGWATEVAENNINPETGKAYSRRAPKLALDRVLERIKHTYDNLHQKVEVA